MFNNKKGSFQTIPSWITPRASILVSSMVFLQTKITRILRMDTTQRRNYELIVEKLATPLNFVIRSMDIHQVTIFLTRMLKLTV